MAVAHVALWYYDIMHMGCQLLRVQQPVAMCSQGSCLDGCHCMFCGGWFVYDGVALSDTSHPAVTPPSPSVMPASLQTASITQPTHDDGPRTWVQFPPPLAPCVAAAAVQTYLRFGAVARASSIAHAAARSYQQDLLPLNEFIRLAAEQGHLVPAMNGLAFIKRQYRQAPTPRAVAAIIRYDTCVSDNHRG